jgi:hypothetical protein
MSLQDIFRQLQDWLTWVWSYPIPWGEIIIWVGIAGAAFVVLVGLAVVSALYEEKKRKKSATDPPRP